MPRGGKKGIHNLLRGNKSSDNSITISRTINDIVNKLTAAVTSCYRVDPKPDDAFRYTQAMRCF